MVYALYDNEVKRFSFSLSDNGGIEISDCEHADLFESQRNGCVIVPDSSGRPVSVPHLPEPAELEAQFKASVYAVLARSDVTVLRCLESGIPVPAAWVDYRQRLRDIAASSVDFTKQLPDPPSYPA